MADGQGRIGLGLLVPVGVVLLAMLTVYVVVFSREEGSAEAEELVAGTPTAAASEPAELAEVWRAPDVEADTGGADALAAARLWAHDGTLTMVTSAGVTGYGTVDGQPVWQALTPEGAGQPCAAAARPNPAGTGAVLYAAAADPASCSVLSVIDTGSGQTLWTRDFTVAGAPVAAGEVTVTVGDSTVTLNLDEAGQLNSFHRFDAVSGDELPLPEAPCGEDDGGDGDSARAGGPERLTLTVRHAGSRIVSLSRCEDVAELSVFHADTGELEWMRPAGDSEFSFTGILAGDPVLLEQGEQVVAYSETGEELWRRPLSELRPQSPAVAGEVLLARTGPESGGAFAGYALADGAQLWERELHETIQYFGLDIDGRPLLGHESAERLRLVWVHPESGRESPAGMVPLDPQRAHAHHYVAYDEHQLYVMAAIETENLHGFRLRAYER